MPRTIHVGFRVDRVALGQVFLWALWFSPVSIIIHVAPCFNYEPGLLCQLSDRIQTGWLEIGSWWGGELYVLQRDEIRSGDCPVMYPLGSRDYFWRGVKQLEYDAHHLYPSCAMIKNAWNFNFTTSYVFMTWCLDTRRASPLPFNIWTLLEKNDSMVMLLV
jgi:hypothetical protein